ncbi:Response regulator receiver domain protein [uncultured Pleomorphomonas sp.]|uniref:Response regulator receiver domain protein n=1 Tax=uncultured Pleomorphomonas sp. TaxID=442121 RepID=A0A212KZM6_9HYPH|nr:response regulator [uncultured Pleomorphomonas sp.]SCM70696.1 Response regulator receiver domain protein [uncultured Pleomorphomonas sp.]
MPHHATYAVPNEQLDVVVIDDSRTMQGIIRSMLNAMKVRRIRLFDSTETALHAMLNEPPSLIICEWKAGLVSGHQLLRMVRARFMEPLCYVPVIILTATPTRAIIDKAMAASANLIVVKPISPAVLQERIGWLQRDQRELVLGPRGAFEIEGVRESMLAQKERAAAVRKAAITKPAAKPEGVAPPAAQEEAGNGSMAADQWQAFLRTKEQLERKAGLKPGEAAPAPKPSIKPAWTALRRV